MRTLPLILHLYERASSRRAFRKELPALFSHLSVDDGHELGRQALALFDQQHRHVAEEILLFLAALVPGALEGLHRGLLVRRILDAPELYRGADPSTRDTFIQLICTGPWHDGAQLEALLRAFAWIGDGEVVEAFARWRRRPPAWTRVLAHPPEDYTEVAGWTLTAAPEDERRDLFTSTCLRLASARAVDEGEPDGAVAGCGAPGEALTIRAGHKLGAACPHCRLPLLGALEIPRRAVDGVLASFGDGQALGERLVLPTCARCSRDGILFARLAALDEQPRLGQAAAGASVRPRHARLDPRGPYQPLPSGALKALGPRRSPFETHREILAAGRSQLGGHPGWLEEIIYPRCPGCDERMPFVAELDLGDLAAQGPWSAADAGDGPPGRGDSDGDAAGIIYAFLCLPCRTSATIAQGTPGARARDVRPRVATPSP